MTLGNDSCTLVMKIELITIGSELLSGVTLNTNAHYVGEQLGRFGLTLSRQIAIPDEHDVIISTLRESLARADWVIVSGGLGPTNDDITKNAIARLLDRPLVLHDDLLAQLRERYTRAARAVTASLDTQALLPQDAEAIPNPVGTAVGFYLKQGKATLVAVPGVPREMRPMISDYIAPRIAAEASVKTVTVTWSTTGFPESRLYEQLEPQISRHPEITVAFLPSTLGVRLRFLAGGDDARARLARWCDEIRPIVGEALYSEIDEGLPVVLRRMLLERHLTLALAESCTGGLTAKRMTDVPGSSAYVLAGFVTYSNEAKTDLLSVPEKLIAEHGAVSEEVAKAMSDGARRKTGADCAVSITGIAGPDGGTEEKPVGTVWIACAVKGSETVARKLHFLGSREMIRERAAQAALNLLRRQLLGLAE